MKNTEAPKIVRTWDEIPPVLYDGDEAFSTRVLEVNYRKMEQALLEASRRFRSPEYGCEWEDAADDCLNAIPSNKRM